METKNAKIMRVFRKVVEVLWPFARNTLLVFCRQVKKGKKREAGYFPALLNSRMARFVSQ